MYSRVAGAAGDAHSGLVCMDMDGFMQGARCRIAEDGFREGEIDDS